MAHIEPTDEQLRLAWQERRRADWPATFEAVMASPMLSRLVRTHACHNALGEHIHREVVVPPEPPPAVHTPARPASTLRVPTQPPLFDRKRAAAGEREDD